MCKLKSDMWEHWLEFFKLIDAENISDVSCSQDEEGRVTQIKITIERPFYITNKY